MNHFFWTKYPFVQVGFAFIGGNALAYALTELPDCTLTSAHYHWLLLSAAGIMGISLFTLLYHVKKRIALPGFFLLSLFVFLGTVRFVTYNLPQEEQATIPLQDSTTGIYGEVISEPEIKNNTLRFALNAYQIKSAHQWITTRIKIKVTLTDTNTVVIFGDMLYLKGKLSQPPSADTPYDFNYARFLAYQTIYHTLYTKNKPIVLTDSNATLFSPTYYAIKTRQKLETLLTQQIKDPKAYALVAGLLVGKRSDLEEEDKQLFTISGTIHVLAVSGMHVVLIYQSICFIATLLRIRLHGIAFNLTVLLLIWFYIFITGLQASASRAAIMITLVLLAKLFQRDNQNINSLMATACLMLLYNPNYLADVGFVLSFLAIIGILISAPLSTKTFKNKITTYLYQSSLISSAAQAATFPYSIHLFHQFPVYFLLANLIIVPLTTLLLFLSVALLLVFYIPYIHTILVWLIELFSDGIFYTLRIIAGLPWPLITRISLSTAEMFLLYAALVLAILLIVQRQIKWLWAIALSLTLLCASLQYRMIWRLHHPSLFISGKKGHRQYLLSSGHQAQMIICDTLTSPNRAAELFLTDHFINDCRILRVNSNAAFILLLKNQQVGIALHKPVKTPIKDDFFKNCEALLLDYTSKYSYLDQNKQTITHPKIFLLHGKKSFYSTIADL